MATTQTSNTKLPAYIEDTTKGALGDIKDWTASPDNYVYGSKPGESLFTPLTDAQGSAIDNTKWMGDQDLAELFGINKAGGLIDEFAAYTPDQISVDKLTDETGSLGTIQSYMDPYLEAILAPQRRRLNESLQMGRRDLADSMTMHGAFGDAQSSLLEGDLYEGTARNIADVEGEAYSNAFNNAMNMRAGDRSAMYAADVGNRDAATAANQNKATAASGVAGLGRQFQDQWSQVNDSLFNAGQVERDAKEEQRVALQQFQEALKGKRYDDAMRILQATEKVPYSSTSTTKNSSDDGIWQALGAGLGALLG